MRSRVWTVAAVVVALLVAPLAWAGEAAPQKVVDLAQKELSKLGTDPVVVEAVKEENAKAKSLAEIQKTDEEWKAHAGIAPYMKEMMDSACSRHLRAFQKEHAYVAEMFLTDNQGANVAMTDKTSDYWQGDEAKFTKSFTGGAGETYLGEVEFDDSSQAYLVQVSVPVVDAGQAVGVLVIGVDVDRVE